MLNVNKIKFAIICVICGKKDERNKNILSSDYRQSQLRI
jgi:hypothetical protein